MGRGMVWEWKVKEVGYRGKWTGGRERDWVRNEGTHRARKDGKKIKGRERRGRSKEKHDER